MKKNKSFTDLPATTQQQVRAEYLSYTPVSQIAEKYNIPRTSLDYHVRQKWFVEREMLRSELFASFAAGKQTEFVGISNRSLEILEKGLKFLAERSEPPTVKEMAQISKIFESIDRIMRLEAGDPTSITTEKPMSIKQIKEQLQKNDPFAKQTQEEIEEIEYTEENI